MTNISIAAVVILLLAMSVLVFLLVVKSRDCNEAKQWKKQYDLLLSPKASETDFTSSKLRVRAGEKKR